MHVMDLLNQLPEIQIQILKTILSAFLECRPTLGDNAPTTRPK